MKHRILLLNCILLALLATIFGACAFFIKYEPETTGPECLAMCYDSLHHVYYTIQIDNIQTILTLNVPIKSQVEMKSVSYDPHDPNYVENSDTDYRYINKDYILSDNVHNDMITVVSEPVSIQFETKDHLVFYYSSNVKDPSLLLEEHMRRKKDEGNILFFILTINGKDYHGKKDNISYYDFGKDEFLGRAQKIPNKGGKYYKLEGRDSYQYYHPLTKDLLVFDMNDL